MGFDKKIKLTTPTLLPHSSSSILLLLPHHRVPSHHSLENRSSHLPYSWYYYSLFLTLSPMRPFAIHAIHFLFCWTVPVFECWSSVGVRVLVFECWCSSVDVRVLMFEWYSMSEWYNWYSRASRSNSELMNTTYNHTSLVNRGHNFRNLS